MPELPLQVRWLRNATLSDGTRCDLAIEGPVVRSVSPVAESVAIGDDCTELDLDGFVLLGATAEPHAHLDKAFSWDDIAPPMGDLSLAIESWRTHAATMTTAGIAARGRRSLLALLRNGTTAVRSHVDLLPGPEPLRGVLALAQLRSEFAGLLDLQLVCLSTEYTPPDVIEAALDLGVDLIGGAPHVAADPHRYIDTLVGIAARRGVGLDLHTDENLDAAPTLPYFARAVRGWPAGSSLSAGHCVRLGTLPHPELHEVIDEVLASDIGIITLPITNLYLQGWKHPVSTPRGLTAVRALLERGVRLGAGADNVQDPFNPVGRSDALETASLLVTAGHLSLGEAYRLVSDGAREVMRLAPAGPVVGAQADLLAVRGRTLADVIASAPADRYVLHAGRLVSQSRTTHHTASTIGLPVAGTADQPTRPINDSALA